MKDAVKRVVEDLGSYHRVATRIGVSAPTVLEWVNAFGSHAKSPIEIAQELNPEWSGILGIDGKPVNIGDREYTVLIAVDVETFDPFYFALAEAENYHEAKRFLMIVKEVFRYPVRAVVSDLGKGRLFTQLVQEIFPSVPHQVCVLHFSRYADMRLPKSKKSKYFKQNEYLRSFIQSILFAKSFNDAEELLTRFSEIEPRFQASCQKAIVKSLRRNFHLLTTHFFYPDLPRDNNIVEHIVGEMEQKLRFMKRFKNNQNAYLFLKLWFTAFRFRPFQNSRYSHRNGLSPLSLAKVDTQTMDWLDFSYKKQQQIS
jgi:transposase-like protein